MPDAPGVPIREFVAFGSFRLFPAERLLEKGGAPVALSSRPLHILLVLVEHAGEVVSNSDLLARVWPDVVVEPGSLRVHMSALRKALGDGEGGGRTIVNIPGRGYCFVAPVSRTIATKSAAGEAARPSPAGDLPSRAISTIGRDRIVATITAQLTDRRFVTIVGAGGIGKTTVALAVASALLPLFDGAVYFIDLGVLTNPAHVAMTVATRFGLPLKSDTPLPGLISFLAGQRLLIVLDSCEPFIETTAALAERIVRDAPHVHILATSRESLRVDGEFVHRLFPLETPPVATDLTAIEIVAFPAVQLFVERATAVLDSFSVDDADAPVIAEICRRLDGIPLAIELAAARVDFLGVRSIAAGLNDLFSLLTKGRRTALPRHQTLQATLDWSYQILAPKHQAMLRRLSVSRGQFAMESAIAIACSSTDGAAEVREGIGRLVATSLLTADLRAPVARYQLLDTTRAYAAKQLADDNEAAAMARRRALHCLAVFDSAEADGEQQTQDAWLANYGSWIDDLRAALDWAFSPDGDAATGIALTSVSAPLWFALSLVEDFIGHAEHALTQLAAASLVDSELEMKLNIWLGAAVFNAKGPIARVSDVSARALQIAEQRELPAYQLRALWKLSGNCYINGDYRTAVTLAERYASIAAATGTASALLVRDRMLALGYHLVGRQAEARRYAERAINHPGAAVRSAHASFHQYDTSVASRSHLARILWVQELTDRAALIAEEGVAHPLKLGYPPAIYYILVFAACPIAFWSGKPAAITHYLQLLQRQSKDFSFSYWQSWRGCYEAAAALGGNDGTPQFARRRDAVLGQLDGPLSADMLGTIREELAGPEAVLRAETRQSGWCAAEILRAHAAKLLKQDGPGATARAETLLLEAIDLAQEQGAVSWELRSATSLARLWQRDGRGDHALGLMKPVYSRLTEGFADADALAAQQLLSELR